MNHPIKRYARVGLGQAQLGHPQMGFSFNDILSKLDSSIQSGLDKAKNDAIAGALKTIVGDPTVQTAIVESGNDAAIQNLAAQLKAAQASAIATVKKNPYTTAIVVGGLGIGTLALFYFLFRRK